MGIAGKTIRTRNRAAGVVACAVVALCAALVCSPAQASASTKWTRLGGNTALDTMALVSKAGHASASTAIVATSADYYDALTAASLAGYKDAPILLTDGHALSSQTRAELERLGAKDVIIAGGTMAVSDSVANSIKSLGCSVSRVWGRTAIDTANAIAKQVRGKSDTCLVATSTGYWDALSASAYACANDAPIFLTGDGNKLGADALNEMKAGGYSHVIICGGTSAVSSSVESQVKGLGVSSSNINRLGGPDAYDTSSLICDWEVSQGMSRDGMVVATGDGFWDALAGSALAGANDSVIILVNDGTDHGAAKAQFVDHCDDVSTGYVLGGELAVSRSTWNYLNGHMVTVVDQQAGEKKVLVTAEKSHYEDKVVECEDGTGNCKGICSISDYNASEKRDYLSLDVDIIKTFSYSDHGETAGPISSIYETIRAAQGWCSETYGGNWSSYYYILSCNKTTKKVVDAAAVYKYVPVEEKTHQEWVSA